MTKDKIMDEIVIIFRNVFEDDDLEINEGSSSQNIFEWDSLNHIYLVVAIEENFKVKFTTAEIQSWENVGDMIEHIYENT